MCGILGIIGQSNVVDRLITGLKRLEYRGYDSTGVVVIAGGEFVRRRKSSKINQLEQLIAQQPISGNIGIGHTRWATHGKPSDANSHPHMSHNVAIVHNGIIENHGHLRHELQTKGYNFTSETDSEVIVYLITDLLKSGITPLQATRLAMKELIGTYSFVLLFKDHPDMMLGARSGSPLAVGYGEQEMFFGSDAIALSHLTHKVTYLNEGDIAQLTQTNVIIYDVADQICQREIVENNIDEVMVTKGDYPHFMLKEIYEQPAVIQQTLDKYFSTDKLAINLPNMTTDWQNLDRLTIVACGTAYYAGLVAKYWFERLAGLSIELDVASEFRYRQPPFIKNSAALFISQSGETADTLAALHYTKEQGQYCLGIINASNSSLARQVDVALMTYAGAEIGVASTKAFTTQLAVLATLVLHVAQLRNKITQVQAEHYFQSLFQLPVTIKRLLKDRGYVHDAAQTIANASDVLYLGRGTSYAIAMEGALKLKELSYIHAEGYAAGEMKHGPIALIDENVPIVVVAPSDELFDKTASNIEECVARKGKIIVFTDIQGQAKLQSSSFLNEAVKTIVMPESNLLTAPILYTLPIQLLAYDTATIKGTDVDQPRNLAKSVTVE